jgi:hypothetical protein
MSKTQKMKAKKEWDGEGCAPLFYVICSLAVMPPEDKMYAVDREGPSACTRNCWVRDRLLREGYRPLAQASWGNGVVLLWDPVAYQRAADLDEMPRSYPITPHVDAALLRVVPLCELLCRLHHGRYCSGPKMRANEERILEQHGHRALPQQMVYKETMQLVLFAADVAADILNSERHVETAEPREEI